MPKEYSRLERVADLIQHTLASIMQREVEDPHLRLVTITAVKVSPDLAIAKIYVVQSDKEVTMEYTLKKLGKLASFLRYHLAHEIKLRVMPQLRFFHDTQLEKSAHLSELIEKAVREDEQKHK